MVWVVFLEGSFLFKGNLSVNLTLQIQMQTQAEITSCLTVNKNITDMCSAAAAAALKLLTDFKPEFNTS